MNTTIFEVLQTYDYEQLVFCQEKELGLQAIIAIHDTTLGPAAGGVRVLPYASEQEAIDDVLRLARGMTYKGALAGVNLGGGKCVVRADPLSMKSEALLRALGRFIQRLGGLYIAGKDVGTNAHDMEMIGLETPHVFSLPVEGTGAVGSQVIKHLLENGAVVTATDTDRDKLDRLVAASPGLLTSTPEDIHMLPVDIYCPCALGAVLNERTLPELHCQIVCGAANNQLADEHCGDLLAQTGIVYAPDYLVNAGGMIAYAESRHPQGFRRQRALAHVSRIADTLERVFAIAREQAIPTYRAADWLAEQRIASVRRAKTLATAP
ncbi:MAG: Glu/Leu/Phe/Val dehydrogenase [Chloroflexi bacterium]|nr:MAG: Glu/Leu/Phe/Val dehydrogenase [Chloroflexota bacterium]